MKELTVLTIDIGTTAIKLTVFQNLEKLSFQEIRLNTYFGQGGKVYQKPEEIKHALIKAIKVITFKQKLQLDILALSTAMHSLLPLKNQEATEILIWSDSQAASTIEEFKQEKNRQAIFKRTGTPLHYMSPFSKLLHQQKFATDYKEITNWSGIKEWLVTYFTGENLLDYSVASATGLFNSQTFDWDEELLERLQLTKEQFPQLTDTDTLLPILKSVKQELGLLLDTQLLIGASDGCLAAYAGYLNTGVSASMTIGTSGAVRVLTSERLIDPEQRIFCYYLKKDYWVAGGPTNNGGNILEWLAGLFYSAPADLFTELPHILKNTKIGAKGLTFLPYLAGERAPLWLPSATGSFEGISIQHTQKDFIRAGIEGIFFNLKLILETVLFQDEMISLSGGVFRNPELLTLAASIFNHTCFVSANNEPAFGLLGLLYSEDFLKTQQQFKQIIPDKTAAAEYEKVYALFKENVQRKQEDTK